MIHKMINTFSIGDDIMGIYLLCFAFVKTSQRGNRYLRLTLTDRSGSINCVVWDRDAIDIAYGTPVYITGTVTEYHGNPQVNITSITPAIEDDVILEQLLPSAPTSSETMFRQIRAFVAGIKDSNLNAICEYILIENKDQLLSAPAAIRSHHACLGGMLQHILGMLSVADFVTQRYAGGVDRDLLIAGIVLHDIGKLRSYTFSPVGLAVGYTPRGAKLGHAALGSEMVEEAAKNLQISEKSFLPLQSLVLHHHSRTDYRTIPNPTLESLLLHQIDMMDSSIEAWRGKCPDQNLAA